MPFSIKFDSGKIASPSTATTTVATSTKATKTSVPKQPKSSSIAALDLALVPVCSCESTGVRDSIPRQYDSNGDVLRGKINHHDVGMCQINETYHLAEAQKLGMDIYTPAGNIQFANYLYEHQGTKPWNWSKGCWGE